MTKKMNRLAAKQWADERARKELEEKEAARLNADLEALRALREHLINSPRGIATDKLREAIDDYAGYLTGNREIFWAGDARQVLTGFKGHRTKADNSD